MSRGILLDIMALYNHDQTLFSAFQVPTSITWVEHGPDGDTTHTETIPYTKQNIIDNILLECAELEVIYPDSDYMKLAIGVWSAKRLYTWQRIADVLYRKYDPFVNMNRHEWRETVEDRDLTGSETPNITDTQTRNLAGSETPNLTDTETRNLAGTNDSTVTGNVNAFNDSSADGVQRDKVTTDQDTTDTGTVTNTHTGTVNTTDTGTMTNQRTGTVNTTDTGTITTTDDYHIEGDSAIRDAQDIMRLETQERLANDLIDIIIEDFKKRFCLMVY